MLAVGSRANDFGIPGVLDHGFRPDGPAEAADRHRALVEATQRPDPHARIAIVGAGATGVALAASAFTARCLAYAAREQAQRASPCGGGRAMALWAADGLHRPALPPLGLR